MKLLAALKLQKSLERDFNRNLALARSNSDNGRLIRSLNDLARQIYELSVKIDRTNHAVTVRVEEEVLNLTEALCKRLIFDKTISKLQSIVSGDGLEASIKEYHRQLSELDEAIQQANQDTELV